MGVCLVALGVVVLCVGGCLWMVVQDARRTGRSVLAGWGERGRWPVYLLAIGATLAVVFAAEGGC